MTLRVAINGFGRIGRNFMRCWLSRGANTGIEVVGLNDTSDPATNSHLLTYDTMLGASVTLRSATPRTPSLPTVMRSSASRTATPEPPLKEWGIDLVIESTGVFNTDEKASMHIQAGAKKVILTAPGKGPGVAPLWLA